MNDLWDSLYGQHSVKNILSQFIKQKKTPHAFLFSGPDGVGKVYAALLYCISLNSGYLPSLKNVLKEKILSFEEPFVKFIFPLPRGKNENETSGPYEKLSNDQIEIIRGELSKKTSNPYYKINIPSANTIKINSIREINKFVSLKFSEIPYRLILISDAHLMNDESQNALLKNLEEPPEGIIFILITPYPSLLKETIKSRCWNISFAPLEEYDLQNILTKYFKYENIVAEKSSKISNGSVTEAINFASTDITHLMEQTIVILRYSFGRKYHSAISTFDNIVAEGESQDMIKIIAKLIIVWLNDLMRFKLSEDVVFVNYKDTLEKFLNKFPNIDINLLVSRIEYLSLLTDKNVNKSLIINNIIFTLAAVTNPYLKDKIEQNFENILSE